MTSNIIKQEIVNALSIAHQKLVHAKTMGLSPKYCIMNYQTYEVIKEKFKSDFNIIINVNKYGKAVETIYGLFIAVCDNLDFGEFEIK